MNLILDADNLIAHVYDWDAADWVGQAATIPPNYTIQFSPHVLPADLSAWLTTWGAGRQFVYCVPQGYTATPSKNGYVSVFGAVRLQQLTPVSQS
jgi:hypothetical protein